MTAAAFLVVGLWVLWRLERSDVWWLERSDGADRADSEERT